MNIVFFAHADLLGSQSMPRFQNMLAHGMAKRGHAVTVLKPAAILSRFRMPFAVRKWLGYIDQYLIFPRVARKRIKSFSPDTLFVFTDHALGPWLHLVSDRPHVIHCHDFLAQRSAFGMIPQHRTGWTGRAYQSMIRRGYSKGKNFISVSRKTREDLHAFLKVEPWRSEVVYNGLNQAFSPRNREAARARLGDHAGFDLRAGYILHVGGNQWYKNRKGVIEIYQEWRRIAGKPLPLLMVGKKPDSELREMHSRSPYSGDVHWIADLEDRLLPDAYSGANALVFPSLAEGFGWPIAEAMACGCPVVTTAMPPMTEVAGAAAFLIPPRPVDAASAAEWAISSAEMLNRVLTLEPRQLDRLVAEGLLNARRFDTEAAMSRIEEVYCKVTGQSPGVSPDRRDAREKAMML